MKTRALLFIIFTVMLFSLGVLITTLFNTAPTTRDAVAMFYVSSFLFLFGLIFFGGYLGFWIRQQVTPGASSVKALVRIVFISDVFLIALLALRANAVLNWATTLVLLAAAVI